MNFISFATRRPAHRRAIGICLAALFFAGAALGQAAAQKAVEPAPPGLKVLGFDFARKATTRLELEVAPANMATIPTASHAYRSEVAGEPARGRDYYQYRPERTEHNYAVLRLENRTGKTIKKVDWEFTYPRFDGDKEVVYSPVRSRLEIPADKAATLAERLPNDGSGVRHVHAQGSRYIGRSFGRKQRKFTSLYPLEARIRRVEFADGSVWRAAP